MELMNNCFFYLMHRNDVVTVLNINTDTGVINQVGSQVVPELLPLGGKKSTEELVRWWNRRSIPSTRNGVGAALQLLNLQCVGSLLVANLGISLTDHYWIKPCDSEYTWEMINLYDNEFSDSIGEFQFSQKEEEIDLDGKTVFTPSASLQGELKKKWIITDTGERYLVKGNYGSSCQQSLNEIMATQIHELQGEFPHTNYKLTTLDTESGQSLGCISENFTNNRLEFIPAIDINFSKKKNNDISEYEFFISICKENGLEENYVRNFMEYQILSDFAITNTDRHFNNFGVLRDTNTLKFIDVAPIFDSGNSMFWNVENLNDNYNLLDINVSSFRKKECQLLDYVENKNIFDLNKMPSLTYITELYSKDKNMSDYRMKKIIDSYNIKCDYIERFQRGENIHEMVYMNRTNLRNSNHR